MSVPRHVSALQMLPDLAGYSLVTLDAPLEMEDATLIYIFKKSAQLVKGAKKAMFCCVSLPFGKKFFLKKKTQRSIPKWEPPPIA